MTGDHETYLKKTVFYLALSFGTTADALLSDMGSKRSLHWSFRETFYLPQLIKNCLVKHSAQSISLCHNGCYYCDLVLKMMHLDVSILSSSGYSVLTWPQPQINLLSYCALKTEMVFLEMPNCLVRAVCSYHCWCGLLYPTNAKLQNVMIWCGLLYPTNAKLQNVMIWCGLLYTPPMLSYRTSWSDVAFYIPHQCYVTERHDLMWPFIPTNATLQNVMIWCGLLYTPPMLRYRTSWSDVAFYIPHQCYVTERHDLMWLFIPTNAKLQNVMIWCGFLYPPMLHYRTSWCIIFSEGCFFAFLYKSWIWLHLCKSDIILGVFASPLAHSLVFTISLIL